MKYLASLTNDEIEKIKKTITTAISRIGQQRQDYKYSAEIYYQPVFRDKELDLCISLSTSSPTYASFTMTLNGDGYKIKLNDKVSYHKCSNKLILKTENEDNIPKFLENITTINQCDSFLNHLTSVSRIIVQYIDIQTLITQNNPEEYHVLAKKLKKFQEKFKLLKKHSKSNFLFDEINLSYQQKNYQRVTFSVYIKGERKKHLSFSCKAMIPSYETELINVLLDDFYACYGYDAKCIIKTRKYVGTSQIPVINQVEI